MWRVAGPSEYLAITGGFIKNVKLAKKAWIWSTQKCVKFYVSPKLPFFIHAVFTISPCVTDQKSLLLYAKLFASHVKLSVRVEDVLQDIIQGQTCVRLQHHGAYLQRSLGEAQVEAQPFWTGDLQGEDSTKAKIKKVQIKVTGTVKIFKNQKKAELAEANARPQSSKLPKVEYLVELLLWNL
ncbi:hypothetical protein ACJRO7_025752 [Eucalyptus globulus]|uniref:Flotillin-like n=1 Tax=Eucalyptus globulus TaxID=34317 RepID=A0ABD3KFD2_EUCGL